MPDYQFRGLFGKAIKATVTVTTPTVATAVAGFVGSVSVPGALPGDIVLVSPNVVQTAGVSFDASVTAADTVAITVINGSAGSYTGVAGLVCKLIILRPTF